MTSHNEEIVPGVYEHYKGKRYEVIGVARHSETLEVMVVYRALYDDPEMGDRALWVRPFDLFLSEVSVEGRLIPRFQIVA